MADYPLRNPNNADQTDNSIFDDLDATKPRAPSMAPQATAKRAAPPALLPPTNAAPADYRLPWRVILTSSLLLWLGTRLLYLVFTYLASGLPLAPGGQKPGPGFFGLWRRFDTNWYLGIAQQGYIVPQQVGFFPLYPALIRVFSVVTGGNLLISALLVSNLAALVALIGLGALVAWETRDGANVAPALLLLLAFPFAFFFAAAYTEGIFLATSVFCIFFARRGQWGWSALCALLAGAARPTGLVLIAPLAWEWLRQNGLTDLAFWREQTRTPGAAVRAIFQRLGMGLRATWVGLLSVLAVPAFFLGFASFIGLKFHHPSLLFTVRRDYWGLNTAPIWTTAYRQIDHIFIAPFASTAQTIMVLDTLTFLAVVVAVIVLWRAQAGIYNVYMLCLLYLSISSPAIATANPTIPLQILQGTGRYLLPSIPLFIGLSPYVRQRPALLGAIMAICLLLQAYIALRFLDGALVE